ncbi:hypothetical protein BKA65DRAFT_409663 [Rhexocercosporidium sp. MPI-PUGE-AT-0058]|nr:hypothetical protein BKA65DRAFT_409663 [Rhexocercosporidium sp. MPI-PUGE-AT-0058]
MAILERVEGLEVTVHIDGQPAQEYDDDEGEQVVPGAVGWYQAARTIRKYVESISDKEFLVQLSLDKSFKFDCPTLRCDLSIDGKVVRTPLIYQNHQDSFTLRIDGIKTLAGDEKTALLKPFKFSKIETSTDDAKFKDIKEDSKQMSEVGEISIRIWRSSEAIPSQRHDYSELSAAKSVHEKALKGQAKSHSTTVGATSRLVSANVATCQRLDGIHYPIAIFKFLYRSKESLKSLLIIERTPSPEAKIVPGSPGLVDLNNLAPHHRKKVAKFLQGLNGNSGRSATPGPSVKRERDDNEEGSSRKKRNSGGGVTIDLTGDSDDDDDIIALN